MSTPLQDMLDRVLPDRSNLERTDLLWSCTAYPFNGVGVEDIKLYERQLKEALEANPDDPVAWAGEQMEKDMDRAMAEHERQEAEEAKDPEG